MISRKGDYSDHQPREAQLAAQGRFRQSALKGKLVMADPVTKQIYEEAAKAKGQPLFSNLKTAGISREEYFHMLGQVR